LGHTCCYAKMVFHQGVPRPALQEKILSEVEKRFVQVDKRFEQIELRFEQVDKQFDQVDKRFESIKNILIWMGGWVSPALSLSLVYCLA
jgi:hypothetical protein